MTAMTAASDAFGMVAAAIHIDRAPWRISGNKHRRGPTPLCLVWGNYHDVPATIAAGAWLGGWERVPWETVASWPSLDLEVRRLDAYTLGTMARVRWEAAAATEHAPHKWNATVIRGQFRCKCGAWAEGEMQYDGPPKFTKRGRTKWEGLDAKLLAHLDPSVPFPPWVEDYIRWSVEQPTYVGREPDTTPEVE